VSGHSKWATIKRKKGAIDAARGKIFAKMSRQLEVATREGGGDPASNATLRTIIQKAKAAHMTWCSIRNSDIRRVCTWWCGDVG